MLTACLKTFFFPPSSALRLTQAGGEAGRRWGLSHQAALRPERRCQHAAVPGSRCQLGQGRPCRGAALCAHSTLRQRASQQRPQVLRPPSCRSLALRLHAWVQLCRQVLAALGSDRCLRKCWDPSQAWPSGTMPACLPRLEQPAHTDQAVLDAAGTGRLELCGTSLHVRTHTCCAAGWSRICICSSTRGASCSLAMCRTLCMTRYGHSPAPPGAAKPVCEHGDVHVWAVHGQLGLLRGHWPRP